MSKVENQMEQAIQDAGFSISDAPPTEAAQPQEAQVAPAENATTENVQPAEEPVQENVQAPVQEQPVEPTIEEVD